MSEYNMKENKSEDIAESIDDTIEVAIMSKVKLFFDLNKKLRKSQLNIFLESINLSDVFGEDEEKEIIWNIFSKLSSNSNEIDYETCQIGMRELFLFYGITENETEDNTDSNFKQDNLYEFNTHNSNQVTHFATTPFRTTLTNFRESLNSKDKKLDELLLRISIKNTPDRFQKFNTPYLDSELPHRKDSIEYKRTNGFSLQNKINQVDEPALTILKQTHERKITKTFTEIDIDKLQQLRKVFTLLDLKNKECVYISEIQDVISKNKFIKMTPDELVNFLRLISDDIIKSGETNSHKFSINFELYSKAISAIEQQLLQVNSDTFEEKNDSYELQDNYMELIEDLNRMETETVDHIMVLADIIKSSDLRVEESLCENYEKLILKKFTGKENESVIQLKIKEDLQAFHNKIKDAQLFLKEINQTSLKKQNKLSSLTIAINKLEDNLKHSEEDYRSMFEKFNMNQPVEIDDETEKLFEENSYLNEQKLLKENKILMLQKELNEKQEQIFNLNNQLEKSKSIENENKTSYVNLKKEFEILENNYNFLVEDIYEKIDKEEDKKITNSKNNNSSMKSFNQNSKGDKELKNFEKIKEKIGKNDLTRKVVEMNYDQLLLYTLNTESLNAQLEEKNIQKDKKIKASEKELIEVKNDASDNSKAVRQLKTENIRLQEKINEMNKEIEMNNMFRPSRVLNNRISRISKIGDNKDRLSNISSNTSIISNNKPGNGGRFNKMQKLFELDAKHKEVNNNRINDDEASFSNAKNSKIELLADVNTEIDVNKECDDLKLKIETQGCINSINIENKNNGLDKQNRITYENSDSCFNNHFTFNNFPNKPTESISNTVNRISNNYALELSSFTNGNIEIFSQADPFASNDKFIFEEKVEKVNDGGKELVVDTKSKERTTRVKYSFSPDDEYYLDENDDGLVETVGHNIIMDYLEENPFPSKNHEEDNPEEFQVEDELDSSVNWNKIAKHSLIEVDMEEIKKNREKLKQSLTRQNTIESTTTATFNNKINKRLPSLITEEILEEDINGDIIGTPCKTEKKSIEYSSTQKSVGATGNRLGSEDNFKGYHNRMNTMDLDLVFNKDSQYVCYDFLTLRKNMGIISMLENNSEDVSSYEMFSDNVFLIDEYNKKSKKYLFITSNSIDILRPYDVTSKIKVSLKHLNKLTISNKNCNLIAFHFSEGNDLLLEILRRTELLYYFRDLYRMKGFGKLKFKYSDNFQIKRNNAISNIIVNQPNNFFIAPNFENAQKLGYLSKLSGRFFTNFNEKLVVLTNVGLLYFDDPNKPPKMLIPIIGSEITKIDEKKYKRKYCFEIKTLNGESYVFGTKADEELDSWITEFKNFKKSYEWKIKNIDNNSK